MTTISVLIIYAQTIMSLPQAKRLVRQSSTVIQRDLDIKMNVRYRRRRDIPEPNLEKQSLALGSYSPYFYREKIADHEYAVIIAPGAKAFGKRRWGSGQAIICGRRAYIGYAPGARNQLTLQHEIGHMLGATHAFDEGVMDPIPHRFQSGRLPFIGRARDEVDSCLGRY